MNTAMPQWQAMPAAEPGAHGLATGVLACLGRSAVSALYDEVALYPKPGLVSFVDSGSHSDMDGQTFMRSLFALRHYFGRIALLGAHGADFAALERCGMDAEARMLVATGGVNTHRGAVFTLGLLCAAAGSVWRKGHPLQPDRIRHELQACWGRTLVERAQRTPRLPGGLAARRHGLRSASEEAACGFPVLFETTYPALRAAMARGLDATSARIEALMCTMAVLDDSNLAHRGGREGLAFVQRRAQAFMDCGGMAAQGALQRVADLHTELVIRRLSPGGSADMLSAACWLHRVGPRG